MGAGGARLAADEAFRKAIAIDLSAVVPSAIIEGAIATQIAPDEFAIHESAQSEDAAGEATAPKDASIELDLDEPRGIEEAPVPGRVLERAADRDAFEPLTFDVKAVEITEAKYIVLLVLSQRRRTGEI